LKDVAYEVRVQRLWGSTLQSEAKGGVQISLWRKQGKSKQTRDKLSAHLWQISRPQEVQNQVCEKIPVLHMSVKENHRVSLV